MHDCRNHGGHFFIHKPQGHPFRCRRCTERFPSSYTDRKLRQPWKCLIERCEYIACDPCSDILAEELALSGPPPPPEDEASLQNLSMKDAKPLSEDEKPVGPSQKKTGGLRRGFMESIVVSASRDVVKDMPKPKLASRGGDAGEKSRDTSGFGKIEADDPNDEEPYSIPVFTRTARQAAAQAALRRTHVKLLRPITRRGAGEAGDI